MPLSAPASLGRTPPPAEKLHIIQPTTFIYLEHLETQLLTKLNYSNTIIVKEGANEQPQSTTSRWRRWCSSMV